MVTERTPEHKCSPESQTPARVSVELTDAHAHRLARVAQAYGMEPDELVAYFLEREETPFAGGCVHCRATSDRVAILNQRITAQRTELRRLNRAIQRGAYGQAKLVEGRALAAMASLDRLLSIAQESYLNPEHGVTYWRSTVLATRRVLARFLNGRYPGWAVLALQDHPRPEDILAGQETIEW